MKISYLLIFWSLWFLNYSTRTILAPLLPIIEDELVINHALAGSIFFYMSLGHTITMFLAGLLSHRFGYKKLILTSLVILVISLLFLKYAESYASFAVISFFIGLGSGIYLPCAIPLITSIFKRDNWGKAIAFHETAASFSIFSIPLFIAFALSFFHWRTLFIFMSGACVVATIYTGLFVPDTRPAEEKKVQISSILKRRDFWIMVILLSAAAMITAGIYNLLPLYLVKEKGIELQMANTIFGLSRVGGFFAMILIGFVLDRFRVKKILLITLLIPSLSTIGIAITQNYSFLVTMLVIHGTIGVTFFPVGFMAISKLTHVNERSVFTGTSVAIAAIVGRGMTPFVLGVIADAWNFQIGILLLGVFTAASCVFIRRLKDI